MIDEHGRQIRDDVSILVRLDRVRGTMLCGLQGEAMKYQRVPSHVRRLFVEFRPAKKDFDQRRRRRIIFIIMAGIIIVGASRILNFLFFSRGKAPIYYSIAP
jgi:hypothetical protein